MDKRHYCHVIGSTICTFTNWKILDEAVYLVFLRVISIFNTFKSTLIKIIYHIVFVDGIASQLRCFSNLYAQKEIDRQTDTDRDSQRDRKKDRDTDI